MRQTPAKPCASPLPSPARLILNRPPPLPSGIYFWWQLGAMQYLASRFDLTRVPMAGASGGALCAVLGRCGVDPEAVTESAYQLSLEHKIWERPLGLVGVWGSIIEKWLDDLLPPDAAARCSGGLGIVVTRLPSCRQQLIDEFTDKVRVCVWGGGLASGAKGGEETRQHDGPRRLLWRSLARALCPPLPITSQPYSCLCSLSTIAPPPRPT